MSKTQSQIINSLPYTQITQAISEFPLATSMNSNDLIGYSQIQGTGPSYSTTAITYGNFVGNSNALLISYTQNNGNPINLNTINDQNIILSSSTQSNIIITNIVLTNLSTSSDTASDMEIWTGTNRTGTELYKSTNNLNPLFLYFTQSVNFGDLITTEFFTNNTIYQYTSILLPGTVYLSLGTPEGSELTIDLYVYGYII